MHIPSILAYLSSVLFIVYGLLCFVSPALKLEFERYGFGKYRVLIALIEIAGAIGLIVGLSHAPVMLLSSALLTALMIGAIAVRIKIKDPLIKWLPALILLFINSLLLLDSLSVYY